MSSIKKSRVSVYVIYTSKKNAKTNEAYSIYISYKYIYTSKTNAKTNETS